MQNSSRENPTSGIVQPRKNSASTERDIFEKQNLNHENDAMTMGLAMQSSEDDFVINYNNQRQSIKKPIRKGRKRTTDMGQQEEGVQSPGLREANNQY